MPNIRDVRLGSGTVLAYISAGIRVVPYIREPWAIAIDGHKGDPGYIASADDRILIAYPVERWPDVTQAGYDFCVARATQQTFVARG